MAKDWSMLTAGLAPSATLAEPVPLYTGLVEAQPNTFRLVVPESSGSRPLFFTSTIPSSPVSSMTARELPTTSSEISALEALSTPDTVAYSGP